MSWRVFWKSASVDRNSAAARPPASSLLPYILSRSPQLDNSAFCSPATPLFDCCTDGSLLHISREAAGWSSPSHPRAAFFSCFSSLRTVSLPSSSLFCWQERERERDRLLLIRGCFPSRVSITPPASHSLLGSRCPEQTVAAAAQEWSRTV